MRESTTLLTETPAASSAARHAGRPAVLGTPDRSSCFRILELSAVPSSCQSGFLCLVTASLSTSPCPDRDLVRVSSSVNPEALVVSFQMVSTSPSFADDPRWPCAAFFPGWSRRSTDTFRFFNRASEFLWSFRNVSLSFSRTSTIRVVVSRTTRSARAELEAGAAAVLRQLYESQELQIKVSQELDQLQKE